MGVVLIVTSQLFDSGYLLEFVKKNYSMLTLSSGTEPEKFVKGGENNSCIVESFSLLKSYELTLILFSCVLIHLLLGIKKFGKSYIEQYK